MLKTVTTDKNKWNGHYIVLRCNLLFLTPDIEQQYTQLYKCTKNKIEYQQILVPNFLIS